MKETEDDLREAVVEALAALFAYHIRHKLGHDPDHSGPEDTAEEFARQVGPIVVAWLDCVDPREPKFSVKQVVACGLAPMRGMPS